MKTLHSSTCKRIFKRYDPVCPRCQELAAGMKPREGWGDLNRQNAEQRRRDIRNHDCKRSHCGPVCTAFDW